MKLEDLKIGDIIVPNGATRSLPTQLADSLDFVCTVVKIYEVFGMFETVVIYTNNYAYLGRTISFATKDLVCFDNCKLNAAEFLKMKRKPLYLKWVYDKSPLGRIGEVTPFTDDNGEVLYVGDTVAVCRDYRSWHKCVVVYDEDFGYFVMGIQRDCDCKKGVIHKYAVKKDSSWRERLIGERLHSGHDDYEIEVTDKKTND